MKGSLKWVLIGIVGLALAVGGFFYYRYKARYPSTNDAYIKAHVIKVTPQVSGQVERLAIDDQQQVHKGQLLFSIDRRAFRYQEEGAEAALSLTRQQVNADQAAVEAAKANVSNQQAQLVNARRQYHRTQHLAKRHLRSQSDLDNARTKLKGAQAALQLAKAKLQEAKQNLGSAGERNQRIKQAQSKLKTAQLNLAHTRVKAPCSGRIAGLTLQQGDMVTRGSSQFALVCTHRYWVYANFKETDLTRIRPGQSASITVDMYPDHPFHGVVESINPASGAAFSLLPPENATGNWVKVEQRVPVRILVVDAASNYPLRVQTSTEVEVDTGSGDTPAGLGRAAVLSDRQALALARQHGIANADMKTASTAEKPAQSGAK